MPFNHAGGTTRIFAPCLIALILQFVARQAAAQFVLTDNNSIAAIDPYSQRGMYHWAVDGQNQLQQQWFWYGIGNGATHSLDTISATPTVVMTGNRELTTTYVSPGAFSVSVDYALSGGASTAGTAAVADIGETIRIINLSPSALSYHFYEYSYFNLLGAGDDIVQLGQNARGQYNSAYQYNLGASLSETVVTPGADRGEVAPVGLTLAKLNSGGPVTLGAPFGGGPVGPGAVTWALEWDFNILPGASALISKDKYLDVIVVPEPSMLALLALGAAAKLASRSKAWKTRNKRKA
jgi:hypothetical protein